MSAEPAEWWKGLTPKQRQFVEEYLVYLNGTQSAIRAGYAEKSADVEGSRLLVNAKIQAAITQAQKARSERTAITADRVLRKWWEIATADPNEIVQHRRLCCRFCHGVDHKYQWTQQELDAATEAAVSGKEASPERLPDVSGGVGFDATVDPHAECPECHGEGIGQVHVQDTRKLKGAARLLYAGAKQTSQGIEVKFRDQDKALELIAKHLGMFTENLKLSGDPENPVVHVIERRIVRPSDTDR